MAVYSAEALRHFDAPYGVVGITDVSNWAKAEAGDVHLGEIIEIFLEIGANNRINNMRFRAFAGVSVLAALSWLSSRIAGLMVSELRQFTPAVIMRELALPAASSSSLELINTCLTSFYTQVTVKGEIYEC